MREKRWWAQSFKFLVKTCIRHLEASTVCTKRNLFLVVTALRVLKTKFKVWFCGWPNYNTNWTSNFMGSFLLKLGHCLGKTEKWKCQSLSCVWFFMTLWTVACRLLCPWNSPGKNTGVHCHSLLQGIFLTQGSNPGLPHCRQILYHWVTWEELGSWKLGLGCMRRF